MNDSSAREMNDSLAAITERQPQRPCGFVGIFFQLFDRNRRFAKKLFLKKLFSLDAKNNGMTDTRCESKHEMKSPSLVARLMGLESMPAGSGIKPQKASASKTWSNVADKLGARPGGSDKEDMDFEIAELKSSEPEDKVLAESVDSVDDEPHFPEPDRDLSDCETSLSTRRSCRELIHNVSGALPVEDGFSVRHFLLNEHEMFSSFLWMAFGELLGCNDPKKMNQLKGFAFDCLLEYLDSKFCPISILVSEPVPNYHQV
ncbi:hypothetical protein BC332_27455 [Capsicum chinense]|nr:hypothetical protein BC332_27455 [Capsicum chinense]